MACIRGNIFNEEFINEYFLIIIKYISLFGFNRTNKKQVDQSKIFYSYRNYKYEIQHYFIYNSY